ncbi:MAG TPA: MFS transporter [Burkholderiaceae bacterium]|nr:MFS transporter [Burkholderiaceae bacterium]
MSLDCSEVALAPPLDVQPAAPHTALRLKRARWAARAQFAVLGLAAGAWGVHIPSVKQQYELGEALLSVLLFAAAAGSLLSLFAAGRLIARVGARRACVLAAATIGATLASVLLWPSLAWLLPAMLLLGAAMGIFDVAINSEGTMLETLSGRTVLSQLHGMFSLGAMGGAALAGALLRLGVPAALQLAAIGAAAAGLAALAGHWMLDAHATPEPASSEDGEPPALFAWPRGQLLVIGLMIFAGMSAEGVMYDWSVLYLKQELRLSQPSAAMGYAAFTGAMALARFGGDALRARFPERLLVRCSAALAAGAMALLLLSGHAGVSIVGYALIGAGLAPVVPILYNAASRTPGTSRAAAIAAVSSIGYAGFMVGPPLIGAIAQAVSLTAAMGVVVVMAGALALGARRI